ncbi:unnamed protein product [Sphagnum balticum]
MLAISFFLSIVADMSPPTSEAVPLLGGLRSCNYADRSFVVPLAYAAFKTQTSRPNSGVFFSTCMMVVAASVVMTVVVLNYHHRNADTHEMGDLVGGREYRKMYSHTDPCNPDALDSMAAVHVPAWSAADTRRFAYA